LYPALLQQNKSLTRSEGKQSVKRQRHRKKEGDLKHVGREKEVNYKKVLAVHRETGLTGSGEDKTRYKKKRKRKSFR
jgi:hypothetical protein